MFYHLFTTVQKIAPSTSTSTSTTWRVQVQVQVPRYQVQVQVQVQVPSTTSLGGGICQEPWLWIYFTKWLNDVPKWSRGVDFDPCKSLKFNLLLRVKR